jgi:hypothetical protein
MDATDRIEGLSADRALLELRLGECVSQLQLLARDLSKVGFPYTAERALSIADRAEAALRTVRSPSLASPTIREAEEAK